MAGLLFTTRSSCLWACLTAVTLTYAQSQLPSGLPTISVSADTSAIFGGSVFLTITQNPGVGTIKTNSLVIGIATNISALGSVLFNGPFNPSESDGQLSQEFGLKLSEVSGAQVGDNVFTIIQTIALEFPEGDTLDVYSVTTAGVEVLMH